MNDLPDAPRIPSVSDVEPKSQRRTGRIPQLTEKEREATTRFLAAVSGSGTWPADPLQERMQSSRR